MAIATRFLATSFLPVAGAALGLCALTITEPAQALGFTPLNYTLNSPVVSLNGGCVRVNTSNFDCDPDPVSNSVTVTGGKLGSFPIGGAGYLYQATESGTVTFDWVFENVHSEDFFGYAIFDNAAQLSSTLNYLPNLASDPSPSNFQIFYNMINDTILADGVSGSGQVSFHVDAGDIFGFGVALETEDAISVRNYNLGTFTISNLELKPDAVPTPAAVLPVLGGLLAAARQKKNQAASDLEQN